MMGPTAILVACAYLSHEPVFSAPMPADEATAMFREQNQVQSDRPLWHITSITTSPFVIDVTEGDVDEAREKGWRLCHGR